MRLTQVLFSRYFKRYIERELHKGKIRQSWHPLNGWKESKKRNFYPNEHRPWTYQYQVANPLARKCNPPLFVEPIDEWTIFKGDRRVSSFHRQSVIHYSTMSDPVTPGCLLGIGNPLLDKHFLEKYDLEANNAIIAEEKHTAMFNEMEGKDPIYGAGGATQNSIRVAQWLMRTPQAATFFGCVGDDDRGKIMQKSASESGLNVRYQFSLKLPTGVCGAVITGEDRSLVANLGAANYFEHSFLAETENWKFVEKACMYYIGGFVFPVCSQVIFDVAEHSCKENKTLTMNLSAPFLCKYYAEKTPDIMPYIDVLFGNETEAATFCKLRGIEATNIKDMALATANLPKANTQRDRLVVFTQGREPTIVATKGQVSEHSIQPVKTEDIRDTNGCGDAFVGGFLSQLIRGEDVDECLRCGCYAASIVIKHWGCNYPTDPDYQ